MIDVCSLGSGVRYVPNAVILNASQYMCLESMNPSRRSLRPSCCIPVGLIGSGAEGPVPNNIGLNKLVVTGVQSILADPVLVPYGYKQSEREFFCMLV